MVYANAISSNTSDSSNKYGASSEKMAAAYAAFANGGTPRGSGARKTHKDTADNFSCHGMAIR